jgi:type I restriction enzyme, S subunit
MKPGWRRVKFGDVVRLNKETSKDPLADGLDRYVGLEHIEPGDLRIRSWGDIADGTTFTNRFRPGQVLFGKRRAYQRKVAVADFGGVCSGDIYVFEPKDPGVLLPELLPFICQTDAFFDYAVGTSAGSLSPRTNWKSLAEYEFALPPLEQQRRAASTLSSLLNVTDKLILASVELDRLTESVATNVFSDGRRDTVSHGAAPNYWAPRSWAIRKLDEIRASDAPICYGIVKLGPVRKDGVPVLRTENLNGDYKNDLYFASEGIDSQYKRSRVQARDIVIAVQGVSTGKIGLVPKGFKGNINRHLARIRLSDCVLPEFFLILWGTANFQAYLRGITVGTTKPELTIDALRKLAIPFPLLCKQEQVVARFASLSERRAAIRDRVVATANQRRVFSRHIGL